MVRWTECGRIDVARLARILSLSLVIVGTMISGIAVAHSAEVRGAHEGMAPGEKTDDLGITVPVAPVDHPGRLYPATEEFPTGPAVGERLPEFTLPNQHGEPVDFHQSRGGSKSIVVFYRSAVW